jgi:hypothetical protein
MDIDSVPSKFNVGDKVTWECEEDQFINGTVTEVTKDEVIVYFPELKQVDSFYLDGKYTKFEENPSLVHYGLPSGIKH